MSKVYDISRAQKGLSISELKKAECSAVIMRLGVGDRYDSNHKLIAEGGQDTASAQFIKECEANNMPFGFYFYSYAYSVPDAKKEISMFIGLALKYKNSKCFKLPCFFDMEETTQWQMMTKTQRTSIVKEWLNGCSANGLAGAIYGNPSFLQNWIDTPKSAKVWLAHYFTSAPAVKSSYISKYNTIGWQYGIDNVNGYSVDINEWYGDIPSITPPTVSKNETNPKFSVKVGDTVKVKTGAKTYDGYSLASFVYKNLYKVMRVNGDKITIGQNGIVTAPVHLADLILLK